MLLSSGARCRRLADEPSHFRVRAGLAERDLLQLLPYPSLERGRPYIERQVEIRFATVEIRENSSDPPVQVAALVLDHSRRGKLGDQLGLERGVTVAEGDAADAALRARDEEASQ